MSILTRILITAAAAVVVLVASHYFMLYMEMTVGSLAYCLIIGAGATLVRIVWGLTAPKKPAPS